MKNLGIKLLNATMIVATIGIVSKVKNLEILEIKKFITIMIAASIGIFIGKLLGKLLDRLLAVFIESCREDLYEKLNDKGEDNPDYKEIKTLKEQWIPILYKEYPHIAEEDKYLIDEYTEKALEEGIRDITIVMEWLECETGLVSKSEQERLGGIK